MGPGSSLVHRREQGAIPAGIARWRPCGAGTVPSEAGMSPTNLSKSPGESDIAHLLEDCNAVL